MVTACLTKAYSCLPSFSEEDRAYYRGMARAGTVFAAGAFLGWNNFIDQNLFSWQNAAAALLGAYTFSGKTVYVFPDFQSRVERLHKEIVEASPTHLQQNLEAYKARCLALGRELVRLPEAKRTPYESVTLVKIRDLLLAKDSRSRLDLLTQLKRLYSFQHKEKERAILEISERVLRAGIMGVKALGCIALALQISVLFGWKINQDILVSATMSGTIALALYLIKEGNLLENSRVNKRATMKYIALRNDLASLKELTHTKHHRAFQSCQDVPSFFRKLFPTTTAMLPQDWALRVNRLPKAAALVKFEKEAEELLKNKAKFATKENITPKLDKTNDHTVNALVEVLKESNPLFKRAWELAGKPKVKEYSQFKGVHARYVPRTHMIEIDQEISINDKITAILFETFNALQRITTYEIVALASDQNEQALLTEWLEHFCSYWRAKILNSMGYNLKPDTFPEYWERVSTPQKWNKANISHTESYRIVWMIEYLFDNPGFLERRLQELR